MGSKLEEWLWGDDGRMTKGRLCGNVCVGVIRLRLNGIQLQGDAARVLEACKPL